MAEEYDATAEGLKFIEKIKSICGNERKIHFKVEEPTDPKYGHIPWRRPLDKYIQYGLIVLDKPPGPTSHEVVAWVKKMLGLKRAGHGGTLEPPYPSRAGGGVILRLPEYSPWPWRG
ncbi:MAG: tRNA pseudouridine synthase A [Desulfurococcales archaeon]|nr:tRNA pseudouridine synthase A [Desulfurococcales archaeon]